MPKRTLGNLLLRMDQARASVRDRLDAFAAAVPEPRRAPLSFDAYWAEAQEAMRADPQFAARVREALAELRRKSWQR